MTKAAHILKGVPASAGIAIGEAFVVDGASPSVAPQAIGEADIPVEIQRFIAARHTVAEELAKVIEHATGESATARTILESYILIAADPVLTEAVEERIRRGLPAETAVQDEFDVHRNVLVASRDAMLRDRVEDLDHVLDRLLSVLRNKNIETMHSADRVVAAGSISPQDVLYFRQRNALALVTEVGGINAHSCIVAREVGLPAVIGIRNATEFIKPDQTVIVDGYAGLVIVDPDHATIEEYRAKQAQAEEYRTRLGALVKLPATTLDGRELTLNANVDAPENVDAAIMAGCQGIGLVRTEMLLVRTGRYPDVDEQYEWYRDIAERAFPLPVTFRAFDVGSDKFREGIPHHEDNPALGLRGIRFLLYRPDIFERQIEAVLRASAHKNVRLMLPMISSVEELNTTLEIIERSKRQLRQMSVAFDESLPIGVMIETPSAALISRSLAARAAFFSIGTNDLAQYTLATDRSNELVADTFDAMHPAVVRLVQMAVSAAHAAGIPVSVCGEMAGHTAATELLVGLGINELSVATPMLLELKQRVRNAEYGVCEAIVKEILEMASSTEVAARLARTNQL